MQQNTIEDVQKIFFAFCLGIFLCFLLIAHPASAVNIITGFSHPESITTDSTQSRIFVSNIDKKMNLTAKDEDGSIGEVALNGTIVQQHFTPDGVLNAHKKLAIADDVIYVADINRIVGFDRNSGDRIFSLDLAQNTSFLNDLIAIGDRVLAVDISQHTKSQNKQNQDRLYLPDSIPYPNGITVTSDGSVIVGSVTTGAVAKVNPQNSETQLLVAPQTAIIASTSLRADEAREVLWACSPDVFPTNNTSSRKPSTLVKLDLNDGTVIKTVKLPQNGFCNDLAIDDRGGVLVTDSLNPQILYLPPNNSKFEVWAQDERFGVTEGFGLAGIAIATDGTVYVGMFANGQLYRIRDRKVEKLKLARNLNNPDGIAIAPDGSLIVCEGNYQSRNGRLLRINLSDSDSSNIEVLAEGLDSPVNLSLDNKTAWVTEGRLRGLLSPELNLPQPDSFWVRRISLPLN